MSRLSYKTLFIIVLFLLIPIVFLLRINQKATKASAAWWNDSWMYRQTINISAHTASQSNVYIIVTVNIGTSTKAQADDGDFRFLDQSGNLLDYFVASDAGSTTPVFHVQLTSFPSGAQTIYAYYGNPSAANGFSTVDFATEASNYTIGSYSAEETGGAPVGWWKFDEGIGTTTYDSTLNRNHGTITNGAWQTEDQCVIGKCLRFNGTSGGISAGSSPTLDMTDQLTSEMWIYWYSHKDYGSFFGKPVTGSAKNTNYMWFGYHDQVSFFIGDGTNSNSTNVTLASGYIALNQWHYLVGRVTSSKIEIWVDGVMRGQANRTTNPKTNSNAINLISSSSVPDAKFDDLKLYNYARSAAQIKQDYTAGLSGQSTANGANVNMGSNSLKSLSDGLVAYYKFDENVGTTTVDYSGNNNLLTFATGDSSPSWITGKFGIGISLDGNDYAQMSVGASYPTINTNQVTLATWVYPSDTGPDMRVVDKTDNGYGYGLTLINGTPNFRTGDSSTYANLSSGTTIANNIWTHILATYQNGQKNIYINGVLKASSSTTVNPQNTTGYLKIGTRTTEFFIGAIDEVRIYNRALSIDDIKQVYNYDPTATASNHKPIAYYKFDEGVGTKAGNSGSAGTTLNGTLAAGASAPTWTSGHTNKALSFNSNNYVKLPNTRALDPGTGDFTWSGWLNFGAFTGTTRQIYYANAGGGSGGFGIKLAASSNNFTIEINGSVGGRQMQNISMANYLNQWHHWTFILTPTDFKLKVYADSVLVSTLQFSDWGSIDSSTFLYFGSHGYNLWYYDGLLDEVKIYNYALSSDEIKTDYNQSSSVVFGSANQTIDGTTTSLEYCLPGDTSTCSAPIIEYKFDEGVGSTAYDTSGNSKHGILAGTTLPVWTSGKTGKALSFNGSDNEVSTSATNFTNLSISLWVKTTTSGVQGILSQYDNHGEYNHALYQNSSNKPVIQIGNDGIDCIELAGNTSINSGLWTHLEVTYDSQTLKMFVNGILDSSVGTTIASGSGGNPFFIGKVTYQSATNWYGSNNLCSMPTSGSSFSGLIDNVRLYNYARTPAQIAWDYNQGKPVAWYKMDECQGTQIGDWSGNNNTGTINIGDSGTQNTLGTCQLGTSAAWTNGAVGKINSSLSFDGSDDDVSLAANVSLPSTNSSVSWWMKRSVSQYETIFGKARNSNSGYIGVNATNAITLESYTNNVWNTSIASGINTSDNLWHHYTVVFGPSNTLLYVDGRYTNSTTANSDTANFVIRYFGSKNGAGYGVFLTGQLDDIRIYNYTLTVEQIKQIYNGGAINFN